MNAFFLKKKKLQPKFSILPLKFQNLQYYDKEKFKKKKIRSVFSENTDQI